MSEKEDLKTGEGAPNAITRRRFIMGVIAGGAVVGAASYRFLAPSSQGRMSSTNAVERLISLNVNGKVRRVDVMKQETLAWTLRYKLGLTGAKLGCVPHYSCSVLTHTVRDRKVLTIEGLAAADGKLHPVQKAVYDEQGFQCGFCTSGFTMAAVAFLNKNSNPTRAELAHGISGNLCRCQDYSKILDAMMRGAEYMRRA